MTENSANRARKAEQTKRQESNAQSVSQAESDTDNHTLRALTVPNISSGTSDL
jgi:hypothetical protein